MTNPRPDGTGKGNWAKFFHGRSLAPLLGPWIACILIGVGILVVETMMPVFHEVVKIIYFILLVVLVIVTGRWFTGRGRRSGRDRRHGERRQSKSDN